MTELQREWQPIETAPVDDGLIDLWCLWPETGQEERMPNCRWNGAEWVLPTGFSQNQYVHPPVPKFWMRVAPPPSPPSKEGTAMRKLTEAQRNEIELLLQNPKDGSSDRIRDRARTKLKAEGLISFDRKAWTWVVHQSGRAALAAALGREE